MCAVWHGDLHKRKPSGGRTKSYRSKRRFETGSFATETVSGEPKRKITHGSGGNLKTRLISEKYVNVADPSTGKTEKVEILRVMKSPSNVDYDRRGVITKGTIIETRLGTAHVTSRPGQEGILNAVLIPKEQT